MIEEITVDNLRSFSEQTFRIAPLTVFIGQNSAGKSSITRLVPLFKQSFEQISSSPMLWNSMYVDYGSMNEVISRHNKTSPLKFTFKLSGNNLNFYVGSATGRSTGPQETAKSVSYSINLAEATKGRTKTLSSVIQIEDDTIEILYDRRRRVADVLVNGTSVTEIAPKILVEGGQRAFVPFLSIANFPAGYLTTDVTQFGSRMADLLSSDVQLNLTTRAYTSLARHLAYRPKRIFKQYFLSLLENSTSVAVPMRRIKSATVEKIRILCLIRDLSKISRFVADQITADVTSSQYVGPIRARAERYYRIQELAIDHIDPQGENVAMYLNYLTASQLRRFNDLFRSAFGYTVEPYVSRGHVSLIIKAESSDHGDNIADVGFGFSQVLPVIAQVFAATAQSRNSEVRASISALGSAPIIAIEQPELHLHPAYQARLADLFASMSRKSPTTGRQFRFIIETHSEAIVNRLGRLVSDGTLKTEDVVIYTFEKNPSSEITTVKKLIFGQDGFIENWPTGFFTAR